jgi:hypothetical protein
VHLDTLLGLIGERETTAAATAGRLREQVAYPLSEDPATGRPPIVDH